MRSRPPKKLSPEKEKAAAAFIDAAERSEEDSGREAVSESRGRAAQSRRRPEVSKPPTVLPWEEPHVREDVNQAFSIRLPEPLYLKLKYISEQTGRSMNHMLTTLAEQMVEERLNDVL